MSVASSRGCHVVGFRPGLVMDQDTMDDRAKTGPGGYRIRAVVWSDDNQKRFRFDASGWFAKATDADIAELHAASYQNDPADALAYHAHEEERNKGIANLFRYLTVYKPRRPDLSTIGFEVRVNPADVYHWLNENRPDLCRALFPDGQPENVRC